MIKLESQAALHGLRKEIMKRSRLKNRYNKTKSTHDFFLYKKQRNKIVNMNRKIKTEYMKKHTPSGNDISNF